MYIKIRLETLYFGTSVMEAIETCSGMRERERGGQTTSGLSNLCCLGFCLALDPAQLTIGG